MYEDGTYQKTRVYFGQDRSKTIDELWLEESVNAEKRFLATVLEVNGRTVLVEPVEGEAERQISNAMSFTVSEMLQNELPVGTVIRVTYTGGVMETYPTQIRATAWELSNDLHHLSFEGEWIDKTNAEKYGNDLFEHIRITKIYADCFFAEPVIPMPYEIKLNGALSDEWCVGDQVICTYENTYYDETLNRVEADLLTVAASDWQPDPFVAYKPVIYLYPEAQTDVSVTLDLDGKLTCTYPAYENGWHVTAAPDGTLTDAEGQSYNYLYWEGETDAQYDFSKGFCVRGEDTAAFLEDALAKLGLTRREANEFIVFWLPMMEQNPYNVITFQTDAYTDAARLQVSPSPDTVIRVFMAWKAADTYTALPPQPLTAPDRRGFTVVEWGGSEIR